MTIANMSDPNTMTGAPVTGSNGEKLGKVDAIYFDNATDKPEWAAVKSGLFASHVALVPLAQGTWNNGTLTVPFDTDALKAAPHHDPDAALSPADENDLYRHYRITDRQTTPATGAPTSNRGRTDRVNEAGPTTDEAMTRSEEQLRVGTNRGAAYDGPAISGEEHEVVLREGGGWPTPMAVPVERVRLGTETHTDHQDCGQRGLQGGDRGRHRCPHRPRTLADAAPPTG